MYRLFSWSPMPVCCLFFSYIFHLCVLALWLILDVSWDSLIWSQWTNQAIWLVLVIQDVLVDLIVMTSWGEALVLAIWLVLVTQDISWGSLSWLYVLALWLVLVTQDISRDLLIWLQCWRNSLTHPGDLGHQPGLILMVKEAVQAIWLVLVIQDVSWDLLIWLWWGSIGPSYLTCPGDLGHQLGFI